MTLKLSIPLSRAPQHQLMVFYSQHLWTKVIAHGEYSNWQFLGQQQDTKPEGFITCTTASGNTTGGVIFSFPVMEHKQYVPQVQQ